MAMTYNAPVEEYLFLMRDVFADESIDLAEMREVLNQAGRFFSNEWAPLYETGDDQGCRFDNGSVRTPDGFRQAYSAYCEAGWNLSGPETGLPDIALLGIKEFSASANMSLGLYPSLTNGAQAVVTRTGSDWMQEHVAPRMASGEWSGTMCLTEPGCGTDLRLMKTRAAWEPDGSYAINGTKIFISGGDHDLTDNIVHLVLAKLPDENGNYADDLSTVALFLVPKFLVDPHTGAMGKRNGVVTGGIERKMGIKGSATCTLHFEDAVGYRLGQTRSSEVDGRKSSSAGMSGMFEMMNKARMGTGVQALSVAERGYQNAANYARERCVGRAADASDRSAGIADPIIVHPDVRRLLLKQAAWIESARGLAAWVYGLMEGKDCQSAEQGNQYANLLTPVIKAFFSDRGFESANDAMQVLGGHGYIKDNGLEQIARDLRILQLYEGANGVQAFDLVTRKLPVNGLSVFDDFIERVCATAEAARPLPELAAFADALHKAAGSVSATGHWLGDKSQRTAYEPGAGSYDLLTMMGLLCCAFMWLRMAQAALQSDSCSADFTKRKLQLARYWFERELPMVEALARRATLPADNLMALDAEAF